MAEKREDREIVITRVLNAPRALVFEVWTSLDHLEKWWGPDGFTTTTAEFAFKVGGVWRHTMRGPDGREYPNLMTYEEIVPPERIVYLHGSGVEELDDAKFRATVTFEDLNGKTRIVQRSLFQTAAERDHVVNVYHAIEGGEQHLANLAEYLESIPIIVERIYNAPIEKVWSAISNNDEMKEWYFTIDKFKPEVGFEFQFRAGDEQGHMFLHLCKVIEVIPGKKLSYTWRYDGYEGSSLVTFELFSEKNKTRLRLTHEHIESFHPELHPEFSQLNFLQGWKEILGGSLDTYLNK